MKKILTHILTRALLLASLFLSANVLAEGPVIEETCGMYRNGKIKYMIFSYRDESGREFRNVRETYRKNGSRRCDSVVEEGRMIHFAKYTRNGLPAVEKTYTYNFNDVLVSIEKKRNGISSFQYFETDYEGNPANN